MYACMSTACHSLHRPMHRLGSGQSIGLPLHRSYSEVSTAAVNKLFYQQVVVVVPSGNNEEIMDMKMLIKDS